MGSTNTTPLNGCANCGGQLQYNFTHDTNKCMYCGSVFKIENAEQPQADDPYQAAFIETPVASPQDNAIPYSVTIGRPTTFKKEMLWGLLFWACWVIMSTGIKLGTTTPNGSYSKSIFASDPFDLYWLLRGFIFCVVWPFLRTRVFYRRY
jgi:hypothetical protein